MRRSDLEHLIRASAEIADDDEVVVLGNQAVLGQFPDAPAELLTSNDADLYPRNHPDRADLIDGSIGELSPFHRTFGYYAHGVGPEIAVLPEGWESRLVPVQNENARGALGLCLEIHDLLVAKYVAGRAKDREFGRIALRRGLADEATLLRRLDQTPLDADRQASVRAAVQADARRPG